MKIFFLKFGQDMLQAYKTRTLKVYLVSIFVFPIFFISCQSSFEFQPENSDELTKLEIEGLDIGFRSFWAYGSPAGFRIELTITNRTNHEIIIKNDIEIVGRYFLSKRLHDLAWDDMSTKEVDAEVLKDAPFKITAENVRISMICMLEQKTNKDFYDVIKEEKFLVKFPTFVIDGKEYEFEPINFVYKKGK